MKLYTLILCICLFAFTACEKNLVAPTLLEGSYTGTFKRTNSSQVSRVDFQFHEGSWNGYGVTQKYPALCNGSFAINDDVINFENKCVWTADFDWSFILNGDYKIRTDNNDQIIISKDYGSYMDIYTLQRIED